MHQQQKQILLLQQIEDSKKEDKNDEELRKKEQEQEQQQEEVTVIIQEGYPMKEAKVKHIYKIEYNIWYCRARRRYKKASYFSERA